MSKAFSKFRYPNVPMGALLNMTQYLVANLQPKNSNASTFESREQYCKDTVVTIWHYHGGCQVGRVVDHQYKVLGVDSLRVIDGSTFTESPGTNPQATLMMLGRTSDPPAIYKTVSATARGGCDKQVKMWPLMSGAQPVTVAMHDAPVKELAWVPEMNLLVTGSWYKTLRDGLVPMEAAS
ncbi:hypothetical protein MRB53_003176 [Persea americana]|uniref:Uncharacterized protein n=1 Tax=Persea americana TaxID=3435 RepID=A0ACC2MWW0_PERAE|nr:hypothetical protein MRB53_003176 [Persea americana]